MQAIDSLISDRLLLPSISTSVTPSSTLAFKLLAQHFSSLATDRASRDAMWQTIIRTYSAELQPIDSHVPISSPVLLRFMHAMEQGAFPRDLPEAGFDADVLTIVNQLLSADDETDAAALEVIEKLICRPRTFPSSFSVPALPVY